MSESIAEYDAIVIGAGFGGCYLVHHLRKMGYKVHGYDAGSEFGGTWHHNQYPGARVDSHAPFYELTIPEVYESWNWSRNYPNWQELQSYFRHMDSKLNLRKDYTFNTWLTDAIFNEKTNRWDLKFKNGDRATCRFFIPSLGLSAAPMTPNYKGLNDKFKGEVYHTSRWPKKTVNMEDKNVVVIGTGASGLQCIQEISPVVKNLYVFQRSPCFALPMPQEDLSDYSYANRRKNYEGWYKNRAQGFSGFNIPKSSRKGTDDTPEQKKQFFDEVWAKKGFYFWVANYSDLFFNKETNDAAYAYWRASIHKRVHDKEKAEKLAPKVAPYPFGCKRPSLETHYYEQYNRPNVHLFDIKEEPIIEFTEDSVITKSGAKKVDMVITATGFDALTGPYTRINIQGRNGRTLKDKWFEEGATTYLGITTYGFPNMFFIGGPQSPIIFTNNPSCLQAQADVVFDVMKNMDAQGIDTIEPILDNETAYAKQVRDVGDNSLFMQAKGWYIGANVPGKREELLSWLGGLEAYNELLEDMKQFNGFKVNKAICAN
ncbi:hypothetical protein CANCADRAFT_3149 [Tortispora caseinolytica NRRL Y-17796]|uniref:Uncharacterized protein n=1 Tax=Tortispora caseinolytica NRRL Y-17796 TaxID=767744 RepID=A0A1E4TA27_9ASCO|nr:hypothetical protein CANCADRAFT_3149 [Tortispora caseinolytica NRRL Y-17796]